MDKSASVGCVIPSSFKSLASYQTAHKSQVTTQCIMYVSDCEVQGTEKGTLTVYGVPDRPL
jgi:hypothetical protein